MLAAVVEANANLPGLTNADGAGWSVMAAIGRGVRCSLLWWTVPKVPSAFAGAVPVRPRGRAVSPFTRPVGCPGGFGVVCVSEADGHVPAACAWGSRCEEGEV
ncbi:hypothetical protein GCM10009738_14190 [Kitasatospora viridis]